MSAVPPSCFDWPRGSGYPVIYGGSTMNTSHPVRSYNPVDRVVIVAPSGAGVNGYYLFLDTRFDTPPSGWNGQFR